jgi:hypothetical protein
VNESVTFFRLHGFRISTDDRSLQASMPLNVMDAHFRSFEKMVLPELRKEDIGVLAMRRWPTARFWSRRL